MDRSNIQEKVFFGNGLKVVYNYGKKIPLIPQKKNWIEDELIMEYNKGLK